MATWVDELVEQYRRNAAGERSFAVTWNEMDKRSANAARYAAEVWGQAAALLQQAVAAHPEDEADAAAWRGLMELAEGWGVLFVARENDWGLQVWVPSGDKDNHPEPDLFHESGPEPAALIAAALAKVRGETVAEEAAPAPEPDPQCVMCEDNGLYACSICRGRTQAARIAAHHAPEPTPSANSATDPAKCQQGACACSAGLSADDARHLRQCATALLNMEVEQKPQGNCLRRLIMLGQEETAQLDEIALLLRAQIVPDPSRSDGFWEQAFTAGQKANAARAARLALEAEEEQA